MLRSAPEARRLEARGRSRDLRAHMDLSANVRQAPATHVFDGFNKRDLVDEIAKRRGGEARKRTKTH